MRDFMHGTSAKVLLAVVFVMLALMLFTAPRGSVVANALGLVATPMQRVSTIITNNAAVAAEPLTYSKEELLEEKRRPQKGDRRVAGKAGQL